MLILDEPTSGLDPKQILETRELIKGLAGDHTIILSTHILPEVEATCERVVIISKGKLVATDTVDNLTNRMRGSENVGVEVEGRDGALDAKAVQQRLEQVSGVSKVILREEKNNRAMFEVESLQGRSIRADLARAVVEGGYSLTELKAAGMTLEDVFLQLTSTDKPETAKPEKRSRRMSNILAIAQKELKSYFVSPIAYALLAIYAAHLRMVLAHRHRQLHRNVDAGRQARRT